MKPTLIGLCLCLGIATAAAAATAAKPNVLVILTEDQGPHLSYAGTPGIQTPNMDALAASGVYFQNAFVAYPVCSASKATLFTGRCSHVNGILNNTQNYHKPASELTTKEAADPIYRKISIHPEIPTLVELLAKAGYYQGVTHKLHVAPVEKFPYDEFIDLPREKSAAAFIANAKKANKPWFLLYNISDSHRSYPDSDKKPIDVDPAAVKLPAFLPDTPTVRKDWAEYLAAVEIADTYVGQALAALKASGQEDNTVIIFLGDHGPSFTRGKMNLTDLGLRIPFVIRAPGKAKGVRSTSLISGVDLTPTVLDLLGLPPLKLSEGLSIKPALAGSSDTKIHEYCFAEISHAPLAAANGMEERSIFDGRFHLIVREGETKPRQVNADLKTWGKWGNRTYAETIRVKDQFPDPYRFLTWMDPQSLNGKPPTFEFYQTSTDPDEMKDLTTDPAYRADFTRLYQALRNWSKTTADKAMKYNKPIPSP